MWTGRQVGDKRVYQDLINASYWRSAKPSGWRSSWLSGDKAILQTFSPHSIAGDGPAGPFRASETLAPLVVGETERTDGHKANQHQNSTYYYIDNQELTSFSVEDLLGASQPTQVVPIPVSCPSFQRWFR